MHASTLISSLYGEFRGYRRLAIRRWVGTNEGLARAALDRLSEREFQDHVHRSIDRFPFYAARVKAHRGSLPKSGEAVRPEELPVWTRHDQREFFAQQERPSDSMYAHQTSGSTSLPVRFHVTRESYEWRTAVMDRSYSWGGAEEGRKSLHVWAADHDRAPLSVAVKRYVHLVLQRRSYFDAFKEFSDAERLTCVELINHVKPFSLVGYTSMLVDLARYVRDNPGVLLWKSRTMVSAAEGLQPGHRELLEQHLVGEVFMSYGSREFMSVGMECERHVGYHVSSDNVRVEVVDDRGAPVAPGEEGRIVITDLHNAATPFVRYEIGDIGTMGPPDQQCACGRPFPMLTSVDGRLQDVVRTPHGVVSGLYLTYTMRQFDDWIEGYQVVQDTTDRILVRLITRSEFTPERLAPVTALLREKFAGMTIDYERVNELTRRRSGKVALVMSNMPES